MTAYEEAAICYKTALELNKDLVDAYTGASHVLIKLIRPEEALDICFKVNIRQLSTFQLLDCNPLHNHILCSA